MLNNTTDSYVKITLGTQKTDERTQKPRSPDYPGKCLDAIR